MQSREKHRTGGSSNPRRPTSAIYWLSQPPDKGGQPRSIRGHPPTYPSILCPTPEPRCILSTQLTLPHEAFSTKLVSCPYSDSANDPPSLKIYTPERVTLNPSNFHDYSLLFYFSVPRLCTLSLFLRRTPRCNALMKIYERNLPSWKFVYPGESRADEGEGVEFGFPDIRRIFENIRCIWRGWITLSKMFVEVYAFWSCLKIIKYKILAIFCKRHVKYINISFHCFKYVSILWYKC